MCSPHVSMSFLPSKSQIHVGCQSVACVDLAGYRLLLQGKNSTNSMLSPVFLLFNEQPIASLKVIRFSQGVRALKGEIRGQERS